MSVILIGWVLFRADTLNYAASYLSVMFGFIHCDQVLFGIGYFLTPLSLLMLAAGVIASMEWPIRLLSTPKHRVDTVAKEGWIRPALLLALFTVCCVFIMASTYNPFIYFRF